MRARALAAIAAALLSLATPAVCAADAPAEQARAHFERAKRLAAERNFREALSELHTAYAMDPRPARIYNIAWTLEQLGREAEALDAYAQYVDGPRDDPALHQAAQRAIDELGRKIKGRPLAILRIEVRDPTIRARVDDRFAGQPGRLQIAHVGAGEHTVVGEKDGRAVVTTKVTVAARDEKLVVLEAPPPEAAPVPKVVVVQAPPPQMRRNDAGMYAGGVVLTVLGSLGIPTGAIVILLGGVGHGSDGPLAGGISALVVAHAMLATGIPLVVIGNRRVPVREGADKRAALGPTLQLVPAPGGAGLRLAF